MEKNTVNDEVRFCLGSLQNKSFVLIRWIGSSVLWLSFFTVVQIGTGDQQGSYFPQKLLEYCMIRILWLICVLERPVVFLSFCFFFRFILFVSVFTFSTICLCDNYIRRYYRSRFRSRWWITVTVSLWRSFGMIDVGPLGCRCFFLKTGAFVVALFIAYFATHFCDRRCNKSLEIMAQLWLDLIMPAISAFSAADTAK